MGDGEVILRQSDIKELNGIDEAWATACAKREYSIFFAYGRALYHNAHVKGLALMKFIYKVYEHCELWEDDPRNVIQIELGLCPETSEKYYNAWNKIHANPAIPDEIKQQLLGKTVSFHLRLAAVANEHPGELDWDEVINMTENDLRHKVRELRGEATSSSTAIYKWVDRKGSIMAKRGEGGEPVSIGYFFMDDDNEVRTAARSSIMRRAGIYEQ